MFAARKKTTAGTESPQVTERKSATEHNPVWQSLALNSAIIQPKLAGGQPDDPHEQEADHIADRGMRMATPPSNDNGHSFSTHTSSFESPTAFRSVAKANAPQVRTTTQSASPWSRLARSRAHGAGPNGARLHTDEDAAFAAERLGANAVTVGRDIFFGRNQYSPGTPEGDHLLRHELAHVAQASRDVVIDPRRGLEVAHPNHPAEREAARIADGSSNRSASVRATGPIAFRIPATPRAVARLSHDQIFGNPAAVLPLAGIQLKDFQDYTEQTQADWFAHPTLTAPDRGFLWEMIMMLHEGAHIRLGIGDVLLSDLRGVVAGDWPPLKAFCRGVDPSQHTVRIFRPFPPLADRIALGRALLEIEGIITPSSVLEVTVSQSQLSRLRAAPPLMLLLRDYWTNFEPFLEQTFSPAVGAQGPEFERVLAFLTTMLPTGLAPLMLLKGASAATRWVRNLHRFPVPMLNRLVANLGDMTGMRELTLILHTGHDPSASFQDPSAANLISNLIMNVGTGIAMMPSPNNLVLMIEGPTSLADMTARIPGIAATWGHRDVGGTRRINQVVIAGHGSGHSVGMAGAGPANVTDGHVGYAAEEHLDTLGNPIRTRDLLDALLHNMDPATARILYHGCLVGSRTVPAGTPAAAIPGALAADQSLRAFTEARATAAGMPVTPGVTVQAARASMAPAAVTSLYNPITGRLSPTHPTDPNVFGSAAQYAQSGLEPEGLLRAAVEIAGTVSPLMAGIMLHTRWGMPAQPGNWYDIITRLMVSIVLPAPLMPADIHLLNEAANVAEVPFLIFWSQFHWINAHRFATQLNPQPFAGAVYAGLVGTTAYSAPASDDNKRLRIIVDQGQFLHTGAAATLYAGILATGLFADGFKDHLNTSPVVLGGHEAVLMPLVGVPTPVQIRLALAWLIHDQNAGLPQNPHVRNFLRAQVAIVPGSPPAFNPPVAAEITSTGRDPRDILLDLGFVLAPAGAPPLGGGAPPPLANVRIPGHVQNTVFVDPHPYVATVTVPAANVRSGPAIGHPAFTVRHLGDTLNVTGFTNDWAAVDINGRLGFIFKTLITPP